DFRDYLTREEHNCPNRRVRNRMHGGVGGRGCKVPSYPDLHQRVKHAEQRRDRAGAQRDSAHQTGPPPSRSSETRNRPYTPILIITPDISADTWLGAAGCAIGSQTCNGTSPAFEPKPTNASVKIKFLTAGDSVEAPARRSAKAPDPPFDSSMKAASSVASPACVIATYQTPARTVPSSFASVTTRKYEVSDIPSHINKKVSVLSAIVTRLIESRKRL